MQTKQLQIPIDCSREKTFYSSRLLINWKQQIKIIFHTIKEYP